MTTTNTQRVILTQPGFPSITEGNVVKFANKMEKFLVDGEFTWDLIDRAGLTYKFNIGDKGKRALKAFEDNASVEGCTRARDAIIAISEKVRSGELEVHFKAGSAAERDIQSALAKDLNGKVEAVVAPEAEDFDVSAMEI